MILAWRMAAVGCAVLALAACGVRGPLEPAAPLWGGVERDPVEPPDAYLDDDEDRPEEIIERDVEFGPTNPDETPVDEAVVEPGAVDEAEG